MCVLRRIWSSKWMKSNFQKDHCWSSYWVGPCQDSWSHLYGADWPLESMLLVISFASYINLISPPSVYETKSGGLYHWHTMTCLFVCQLLTWWLCRRDTKTVVHSSYKEKVNTWVRWCRQNICACWIFRPSMGWFDTVQTQPVLGIEALLFPRCLLGGLPSLRVDWSIHCTGLLTPGSFVSFS